MGCVGYQMWRFRYLIDRAFKVYSVVHLMPVLLHKRKQLKQDPVGVLKKVFKNIFYSCLFWIVQANNIPCGFCISTRITGDLNRFSGLITCFIASLAIVFESAHRRIELFLYLAPKFLEGCQGALVRRGLAKEIPFQDMIILVISFGILGMGIQKDKGYMKEGYKKVL